jgi:hypothetical protein
MKAYSDSEYERFENAFFAVLQYRIYPTSLFIYHRHKHTIARPIT